jgi:hypothetical protein
MTIKTWLSKKKNQRIVYFVVGAILLYFWIKNRAKSEVGYSDLKGGYIGGVTSPGGATSSGGWNYGGDVQVTNVITPKLWYQGWEPHCEIRITGSSENWRLKDHGTESLPNGCIWRYQVNGHVFHQMNRLDNYQYESNDDVAIWVLPVYIDKQHKTLNFWGGEEWQDPHISPGFSLNTSLGQSYYIFNKAVL